MGTTDLVVEIHVGETKGRGIRAAEGIVDLGDARPMNGTETHGARLAGRVEDAAIEVWCAEGPAGIPNGHDFGMSGGILLSQNLIGALADHPAVPDNHAAKGASGARLSRGRGQIDRPLHGVGQHFGGAVFGKVSRHVAHGTTEARREETGEEIRRA
jgi:hypothetical protein